MQICALLTGRSFDDIAIEENGEGISHIAFSVENYDESVSKLKERGARSFTGGLISPFNRRWCQYRTKPWNIILELFDNPVEDGRFSRMSPPFRTYGP